MELEVSHAKDSKHPWWNVQGPLVLRAESLVFYFLPSLTVRLFYSICTQVPSVTPFHILFKAFSHSCPFCIPHHYNVDNSAEIPISVLLGSSIQPLCYWEASAFSSSSSCSRRVLLLDPQYKDAVLFYFWNAAEHPFLSCLYYSQLLSSYNSLKENISKQNTFFFNPPTGATYLQSKSYSFQMLGQCFI